jgi:Fe-S-cluster containining protein
MIEFVYDSNGFIELKSYSNDCTVEELLEKTIDIGSQINLCKKCGKCCFDTIPIIGSEIKRIMEVLNVDKLDSTFSYLKFPCIPSVEEKTKNIVEIIRSFGMTRIEATMFYEFNAADPIIMNKNADGQCISISNDMCVKYKIRPMICRLYHCKTGAKLSNLREILISQGIWHSYLIMDWINENDIPYNPFLKSTNYDRLFIKDFDISFEKYCYKM